MIYLDIAFKMKSLFIFFALIGFFFAQENRIIGGQNAKEGEFPYQISLQYVSKSDIYIYQHVCGGSIVSNQWIVSAAHCFRDDKQPSHYIAVAGITNLDDSSVYKQIAYITSINVHPGFQRAVGLNDIALLKLKQPLRYTAYVKPITLPSASLVIPNGEKGILSGWGSTSKTGTPSMPKDLKTTTLPFISLKDCSNAFYTTTGHFYKIYESNLCAGPFDGSRSSCIGDSGGPLVYKNQLVGVVSWGLYPCGRYGIPSVYTKVQSFLSYIRQYVPGV